MTKPLRPAGPPESSLGGPSEPLFWIDRNGIGGFWATQILPFVDPVAVPGYFAFETAVYEHLE